MARCARPVVRIVANSHQSEQVGVDQAVAEVFQLDEAVHDQRLQRLSERRQRQGTPAKHCRPMYLLVVKKLRYKTSERLAFS